MRCEILLNHLNSLAVILVDKTPPQTARFTKYGFNGDTIQCNSITEPSISSLYSDVDPWYSASSNDFEGDTRLYTSEFILHTLKNSQYQQCKHAFSGTSDPNATSDQLRFLELEVIQQASRYWATTFRAFHGALDWLETSLFSDDDLHKTVREIQYLLGHWRAQFPQVRQEIDGMVKRVKQFKTEGKLGAVSTIADWSLAADKVEDIDQACTRLKDRVDRAYESLMGTLSIMQSQEAIRQGHQVKNLTELAFIYVPMSFLATFLGMYLDIKVGPSAAGVEPEERGLRRIRIFRMERSPECRYFGFGQWY